MIHCPQRPRFGVAAIGCLLALGAALAAPASAQLPAGQRSPEKLFAEAEQLFNSARQPDSIPAFSRLIAILEMQGERMAATGPKDLLQRSLYYRARAYLNLGDDAATEADLRTLIQRDPRFEIDRNMVSPKLVQIFDAVHAESVGYLLLVVSPEDAHLTVNGITTAASYEPVPVLVGTYDITVDRPGFAAFRDVVEVTAATTVQREVTLERDSATVALVTRPAGATVLLDGVPVGSTRGMAPADLVLRGPAARYASSEFSEELRLDDILPGEHEIEIQLAGYRPLRAQVQVNDLVDFHAGGLVLEPLRGTVVLNGLPDDATVTLNGSPTRPRTAGTEDMSGNRPEAPFLDLAPGDYRITVTQRAAGVYEETVNVLDRDLLSLDVTLRPSIAFLGVLGNDNVGVQTVTEGLRRAMRNTNRWAYLERSGGSADLAGLGATTETLRDLALLASPTEGAVDWNAVQAATDQRHVSSVYLLAVLSDDLLATHADLWVWPAAPGPSTPDRIRIPLDDVGSLVRFAERLEKPFSGLRSWLGALLVDSDATGRPVIFGLTPDGPAAQAGLRIGDVVTAVDSMGYEQAAEITTLVAAADPGSRLVFAVRRGGATIDVEITLGSSPFIIAPGDPAQAYAAVWAAGLAAAQSDAAAIPAWIADLNVAGVLMQARMWNDAVRRLRAIRLPADSPQAQAMVDYYLGIALESVGPEYLERAREALSRAAAIEGARLLHFDGPFLAPRALARLARMGGPIE